MPKGTANYSSAPLTGERRLVTLFVKTGQIVTNSIESFNGYDTNAPSTTPRPASRSSHDRSKPPGFRPRSGITLTEILISILIMGDRPDLAGHPVPAGPDPAPRRRAESSGARCSLQYETTSDDVDAQRPPPEAVVHQDLVVVLHDRQQDHVQPPPTTPISQDGAGPTYIVANQYLRVESVFELLDRDPTRTAHRLRPALAGRSPAMVPPNSNVNNVLLRPQAADSSAVLLERDRRGPLRRRASSTGPPPTGAVATTPTG